MCVVCVCGVCVCVCVCVFGLVWFAVFANDSCSVLDTE